MEKKKDAKRTFTIAALVVWLVVSLIGTYFYIDFGGALGDSRIFLWLYAPVILFASRFAARREGAELNRLSQVIVTFGCGGLIYLMLVLGYNPLCEVWFWVIIIMLVFGCVVKILGLESMLHPPKGCDSAYVVILLYCSYLIAIVGLSVVMHPLSVSQIRVVGEAEGYQYIGWTETVIYVRSAPISLPTRTAICTIIMMRLPARSPIIRPSVSCSTSFTSQ